MNQGADSLLEEVCDALATEIEDVLDQDSPVPDLHDVFARARALDEGSIVAGLSPDIDPALLCGYGAEVDPLEHDVAFFRDALRGELAAHSDPQPAADPPGTLRRTSWIHFAAVGLLAAAAIATLWLVPWQPLLGEEEAPVEVRAIEAQMQADDGRDGVLVAPGERRLEPAPAPEPAPELEPEPEPELELEPKPTPRRSADVLEQRARRYWESGDLDRAAQMFHKVIARSGKSSAAELAFGDLFAIARQQGGRDALAKVWKEYLQRFPKGRYADDARGGLCRSSRVDTMTKCWNRYLADFPTGAHAVHARAALSKDVSP